ncbi:MAG: hypothetical protein GXY38_10100 [Planctomycetes bacterium]|nr:hypothetical protein [Planctomycetota bacterium]
MTELTHLERAVLVKLLEGAHPLLERLRHQLSSCRVSHREMTGHGFYTYFDIEEENAASGGSTVILGDVCAEVDGMEEGAGFLLYIEQGHLTMLEGYAYDEPWPCTIAGYTLSYNAGEQRDWNALWKVLEE